MDRDTYTSILIALILTILICWGMRPRVSITQSEIDRIKIKFENKEARLDSLHELIDYKYDSLMEIKNRE